MLITVVSIAAFAAVQCLALLSGSPRQPMAQPETAEWVARQADKRDVGQDGSFELKMRLFDGQQRVRERELTIKTMRAQPPAGSKPGVDGDRMLIRFTYPNDIKGTAFLVWEHPDAEDERFLCLPALGRVRRNAAKTHTDLTLTNVRYNIGLSVTDFTRRELERK